MTRIATGFAASSMALCLFLQSVVLAQQSTGSTTRGQNALNSIEQEARDCPKESRRDIEEKKHLQKNRKVEVKNLGTPDERVSDDAVAELDHRINNECVYD